MERFDTFGVLQFYDFHDAETMAAKFPMIRLEEAEEAMIAVTEELKIFKGFYTFRQIMLRSPWFWLFLPVFYFPGASYIGSRLYSWIAKNRSHLGCRLSKP
jgi:predicted DCC family thiol-disulfide oxidoreductase YuxK